MDSISSVPNSAFSVNILLVDDLWENLNTLTEVLDDPSHRLTRVASGKEALERLRDLEYTLVLIDTHMSEMAGFRTAQAIRKRKQTRRIPIIFITASYQGMEHLMNAYQLQTVDYIIKPLNPQVLRFKIAVFAQLHRETVSHEITEHKQVEEALQTNENRLRSILEVAPIGIGMVADRIFQEVNNCFCEITGYSRAELLGQCARIVYPSDQEYQFVGRVKYHQIREHGTGTVETRFQTKDGRIRDILLNSTPLDPQKLSAGITFTALDITERKKNEDQQRLLIDELDHRVKNTLATIVAISDQTLRTTETSTEFNQAFRGRLHALAMVHESLAQRKWTGANLRKLVEKILKPYADQSLGRFTITGEDLMLPLSTVQPIAMALHELTTNAAKYGALSVTEGRLAVRWEVRREAEWDQLRIRWTERDGPPVMKPSRGGLGSTLIQEGLRYGLNGEVKLDFARVGLRCEIGVRLNRKTQH